VPKSSKRSPKNLMYLVLWSSPKKDFNYRLCNRVEAAFVLTGIKKNASPHLIVPESKIDSALGWLRDKGYKI
jgi:hypothetical protein